MKQQVLVIGGGTTFSSYKDYIFSLKNRKIDLDGLKPHKDWKSNLQEALGENFEVFVPKMPNVANARFKEWSIWFERILKLLREDIILVGHSLGGTFIARYLSENRVTKKIKAVILVAAPFDDKDLDETLAEFNLGSSLKSFVGQVGRIYLVFSEDDPVVPVSHIYKWKKAIPTSEVLILDGMGHFKGESFPQIVSLIKRQ